MERVYRVIAVNPLTSYKKYNSKGKNGNNNRGNHQNTDSFGKTLTKSINHEKNRK